MARLDGVPQLVGDDDRQREWSEVVEQVVGEIHRVPRHEVVERAVEGILRDLLVVARADAATVRGGIVRTVREDTATQGSNGWP